MRLQHVMIRTLIVAGVVVLAGCGASKPPARWRPFVTQSEPETQVDSLVHFNEFRTFTIVPYSALASDVVVAGKDEHWEMFALANGVTERGYRYVENLDSADFVLVEKISDDFDSTMDMHAAMLQTPTFLPAVPFPISERSFGSDASLPGHTSSFPHSHPVLKIYAYTNRGKVLYRWAAGGLANDEQFVHASQFLRREFVNHFPMSDFMSENLPLGSGRVGVGLMLWSRDGTNFWPEITRVLPHSPAEDIGLRSEDEIVAINGRNMKNLTYQELFLSIRGNEGDLITIERWRAGEGTKTGTLEVGPGSK